MNLWANKDDREDRDNKVGEGEATRQNCKTVDIVNCKTVAGGRVEREEEGQSGTRKGEAARGRA